MNQIRTGQQGDADGLASPIGSLDTLSHGINLMIEMVEHDGSGLVFFLQGLPGVDHQPVGGLIDGELAHGDSTSSAPTTNEVKREKGGYRSSALARPALR